MWLSKFLVLLRQKYTSRVASDHSIADISRCPQCSWQMHGDLILHDGKGVNALHIKQVNPETIAGYGFYCVACQRGWTGTDLDEFGMKQANSEHS